MNIQVDIGHPAHVHYLKNFFKIMKGRGHHFLVSSRNRSPAPELLRSYEIDFLDRGKGAENMVGKILNLPKINYFIYRNAIKHKTDLFVGFMNPYLAHVAHFLKKPSIIFEDTDNASMNHRLYSGFASTICSPSAFKKDFGKKHIKFNGYLELAYLHPNYFSPDLSVLELLGVKKGEKYAILRFVKWNANHDLGHTGITPENKIKAVQEFAKHARVFISSESELPEELESFKIKIPPEKMHDALAFSALLYGESATMASECAVLGTPAIYLDDFGRGYTNEEEQKYGLVFNFTESQEDQGLSIEKGIELLTTPGLKQVWQRRRQKLLNDKIDVTNFMVWFVENYPDSVRIMQANPDFRSNFNAANGAPQVLRHHPGSLPSKTEATYPEY